METTTLIQEPEVKNNHSQPLPPPAQMMQMVIGYWNACCLYPVAKLAVADLLAERPLTAAEIANLTHTNADAMYRVLRALSSVGVFSENDEHHFELTPLGNTLRSDVPGSMRAMVIAQLGDHYSAWGNLLYSVQTGKIAFDHLHGMSVWKYYETHPEEGINFTKAMSGLTQAVAMNHLPAYHFNDYKTIVDVGGGNGALMTAVLQNNNEPEGIVYDEPYIEEEAKQVIEKNKLSARCRFEKGSFFESVPANANLYLMKLILHDWNDEQSLAILNNVNKAMNSTSRLLIIESVIPEGNVPHPGKFMDINMLNMTGGRERTENDWKQLLAKAGLNVLKIISTHSPLFSLIEAKKK